MEHIKNFLDFIDNRAVVRRIVLFAVAWMTWRVTDWAFQFAHLTADKGGVDVAATIAAVTAPFAALQAFVFKWYGESRQ